jgi:hypothetical protein
MSRGCNAVLVNADAEVTGLPVARQIIGKSANRLAELWRVFQRLGTLQAIGFEVTEQTLDFVQVDQQQTLLDVIARSA